LGRHAAAAGAATETTAAAAAAKAATAAESVAAATEAITTAESVATAEAAIFETAEIVTAEIVALVSAAPATLTAASFIETHALFVFPVRPEFKYQSPNAGRQAQVFGRHIAGATPAFIAEKQGRREQIRRELR
jgi:hypothetical protein